MHTEACVIGRSRMMWLFIGVAVAVVLVWASIRTPLTNAQEAAKDLPTSRLRLSSISRDAKELIVEIALKDSSLLYKISLAEGRATRLTDALAGFEGDSSFSPDGKNIAFTYRNSDSTPSVIMVVDAISGKTRVLIESTESSFWPHFDSHGKHLYFAKSTPGESRGWDLYEANSDGKNIRQLTHESFNHDLQFYLIALEDISPDGQFALLRTDSKTGARLVLYPLLKTKKEWRVLAPQIANQPSHPQLRDARFSADGSSIYFFAATQGPQIFDYDVYRLTISTGKTEKLTAENRHASDLELATAANIAAFLKWDLKTTERIKNVPDSAHVILLDLASKETKQVPVNGLPQ